jgi:hypothetical protein
LKRVGLFDEKMRIFQNTEHMFRLAYVHPCAYNPHVGYEYRIDPESSAQRALIGDFIYNLELFYVNFKNLIGKEPINVRRNFEKKFLSRVYKIIFQRCIIGKNFIKSIKYFYKILSIRFYLPKTPRF